MNYIELHTGCMSAKINTVGAELVSLKKSDKEYLWQGDPAFWHGQSPLLFPACGSCWNGKYRIGNEEYSMPKHGFVREMEFDVINQTEKSVTLAVHSNDDTLRVFPYPFFLFVTYRLSDSDIEIEWLVNNQSDAAMYFGIGAHPAFYLPDYNPDQEIHGYFKFDTDKPIEYLIPTEKGCVDTAHPQTLGLDSEGMMPITAKSFDIDTYVIESKDIKSCSLLTPERKTYLTVEFNMPVLSLWSPTIARPDCPFVAIEPWYGSCDAVGFEGEISDRRHINKLEPTEVFRTSYKIKL